MKNLENFIHMHRIEFDVYQPSPKVWAGVSSGLTVSVLLLKLAKLLGTGSKNVILALIGTVAVLTTVIWTYQSNKSHKSSPVSVAQSTDQGLEDQAPASKALVPGSTKQMPFMLKEPGLPGTQPDNAQPISNNKLSAPSAVQPGDSFYNGVKTLNIESFGYNFKMTRSDSKMTRVRILKPGKVIDKKTNTELVLEIKQKGSELIFEYEGQDEWHGSFNHQTVNTGEIEILIPDDDISQINAISSNIDINGYATRALGINAISGNINASNIKAILSIGTTSGDQSIFEITGDLDCNTTSGNINLKEHHGNAKIQTASGDIAIKNSRGDLTCKNISGKIKLEGGQGKMDINTVSGDINGELISLIESCNIKSTSGNVEMGFQNIADDLSFDLSSLSGDLKIKKGGSVMEGKGSLKYGSGKIPVTAKTVSGNQEYR